MTTESDDDVLEDGAVRATPETPCQNDQPPEGLDASQWLANYGDAMYRYALARLHDPNKAEEAVQETLLAALRSRDSFRGESRVSTWLFSILRFKVADYFRGKQRNMESLDKVAPDCLTSTNRDWSDDPAAIFEDEEFWKTFHGCVEKLPEKFFEVYALREINRHSPKEICNILGITPTNLSMRLHRCRLALRDCLQKNWFRDDEVA